jgi:hypothetical protein
MSSSGKYRRCPICGFPATDEYTGRHHMNCVRCGEFIVSAEAGGSLEANPLGERQAFLVSSYVRENQGLTIIEASLPFLRSLQQPSVVERGARLLKWLGEKSDFVGAAVQLPDPEWLAPPIPRTDAELSDMGGEAVRRLNEMLEPLAITWSAQFDEVDFLLKRLLGAEQGFVSIESLGQSLQIVVTAPGWQQLQSQPHGTTNIGFVAMWFAPEMNSVWEQSFYPAIKDAGYVPLRIDKKEHNNKIDDEIMASVRAAKFIVADFTGQRGGVYYEAGFAQGLGKPVIWTIRHNDLKNVHFDTRQFNHIPWDVAHLQDFKLALQRRIEGSLGHGPGK